MSDKIAIAKLTDLRAIDILFDKLYMLQDDYPDFPVWYFGQVIPETLEGKRTILVADYDGDYAGVAILKHHSDEKKICTLRVESEYRNQGIAKALLEMSFNVLETTKPLVTVGHNRLGEFEHLFNKYGFWLSDAIQDIYKPGNIEYIFNSNGVCDNERNDLKGKENMSKKITDFTWEEFWNTQETYNDMMIAIEERALEIAKDLGKNYKPYQLVDTYFNHDNYHEYVVAEFCEEVDGEEKFEHFQFNKDWLFSDDYKKAIETKEAKRKAEEEAEYKEYLRLKAKFEKDD